MFAIGLVGAVVGGLIFAGGSVLAGRLESAMAPQQQVASVPATDTLETAAASVLPSVVNVSVSAPAFTGIGSGIILRPDGYILTNYHVVEGATRITVTFGTNDLVARVVGTDPTTDIAVIHVAKTGLPAAAIGSSTSLKVGQTVIAIGSPFGLDKTVTSGIVSALHRSDLESGMNGITSYTNLIQTDAAINPGNSGGALADLSGAVVGMNTLIQSPSGALGAAQSAGIGFAIPIDFAKSVADTLISGKKVTHPYLGASYITVTPDLASFYGLGASSGALVQDVTAGSPAESAGIRVGDIIVQFGTHGITGMEDLFAAVDSSRVGVPIPVEVSRDGQTVDLTVTLVAQ
jgi:putative serine protease PepD